MLTGAFQRRLKFDPFRRHRRADQHHPLDPGHLPLRRAPAPGRDRQSTNAIESLNARYRRAIRVRGHFPTEQAALKCLYLVTRSLDPTGTGQKRVASTKVVYESDLISGTGVS